MREVEHASRVTTTRPRGATRRLHELLETVHRMKSDRYAGDSKMHEMVAAAMQENRDVCKARIDCIIGIAAAVITDGVASSEFSMRPMLGTRHLSRLLDKGEHHGRSSET
jgi:hypothetical protein